MSEELLRSLTVRIQEWSRERELDRAQPIFQMQKLAEEMGELNEAMLKDKDGDKRHLMIDAIGDIYVVLTILCEQLKLNMHDVLKMVSLQYEPDADKLPAEYALHLMADVGQLANSVLRSKAPSTHKHHIAWCLEYLINVSKALDISFVEAVNTAYQEIKARKGEMRGGVFVKEEDL